MASILGSLYKTQRLWRKNKLFGKALAIEFLRLQMLQSFVYKFLPCQKQRVLGQEFHFFRFRQFVALFEEIYVGQPYVFKTSKPDPVILDCGSNIGIAALFFKKLYPGAKVQCYEPDPQSFALLQKNIEANGLDGVALHNIALAGQEGTLNFYFDPNDPGNLCMSLDQDRMNKAAIPVPAKKLSAEIHGPIDFAKIDVEGAEQAVLDDLIASGKIRLIDRMFIEYHHHLRASENRLGEFLSKLENAGFSYSLSAPGVSTPPETDQFQDIWILAQRR